MYLTGTSGRLIVAAFARGVYPHDERSGRRRTTLDAPAVDHDSADRRRDPF
jgi:hypothetical protein